MRNNIINGYLITHAITDAPKVNGMDIYRIITCAFTLKRKIAEYRKAVSTSKSIYMPALFKHIIDNLPHYEDKELEELLKLI